MLYVEPFSGVAGDMLLAALLDAGAPLEELRRGLDSIKGVAGEWGLEVRRVLKSEGLISACKVEVTSKYAHAAEPPPGSSTNTAPAGSGGFPDHSHSAHEHGHSHDHGDAASCSSPTQPPTQPPPPPTQQQEGHGHSHSHAHGHSHDPSSPSVGPSRNLAAIKKLIKSAVGLSGCRKPAVRAFTLLAEAEAATHGCASGE